MKRDIKQLKEEMTAAGFRAAPFAYIVWTIRRILWPFLRQYHFLQLEKLVETEEFITQGLEKLTVAHVQLRSDVAALTNRQGQMAIDLDNVAALTSRQGQMASELENVAARQRLFLTNTDVGVFVLKSGDLISEFVVRHGCWDSHLMPVLEQIARKRQGTAVDVGAHLGLLSAAMAKHFRRVISFEPNDFNYRLLVANMAINRLLHVECCKTPLFSKAVQLSLGKPEDQEIPLPIKSTNDFDGFEASNLGAYSFTHDGTGIFPAMARTLDSYALDDVAFVKIDTQGADGEIVRGAMDTIRRCQPVVVFEWEQLLSRKYETSIEDVVQLFREANYDVEVLKRTNDKQSDYVASPRGSA
jgi:FkbM family methyltransferase